MFGNWGHIVPVEDLAEKERTPPPSPTPLDFPGYRPPLPPTYLTEANSQRLYHLLSSLKRPSDISSLLLQNLNLTVTPDVSFSDLLPPESRDAPKVPTATDKRNRLNDTIEELGLNHQLAFREVLRLRPLHDEPRVRLTHSRKFYTGLEKMSQHWDCSTDQFYDIELQVERPPSNSDLDIVMSDTDQSTTSETDPTPALPRTAMKTVYKGIRLGNGANMPIYYRDETILSLVESVVWPFGCQVRAPYLPPRLTVKNLLFPVRQSYIVGRVPTDRQLARRGVIEGPVLGICTRPEIKFHAEFSRINNPDPRWREVLDLSREIGVMLLTAQERARDGQIELRPGEGKWWTQEPRWGGGSGNPVFVENDVPTGKESQDELPLSQLSDRSKTASDVAVDDTAIITNGTSKTSSAKVEHDSATTPRPLRSKRKARPSSPTEVPLIAGTKSPSTKPSTTTFSSSALEKQTMAAIAAVAGDLGNRSSTRQHRKGGKNGNRSSSAFDMDGAIDNMKLSMMERWKLLKPGQGIWDRLVKYTRIGAPEPNPAFSAAKAKITAIPPRTEMDDAPKPSPVRENGQDTIIMVTAINHHVALLSMNISDDYLDWLAGSEPELIDGALMSDGSHLGAEDSRDGSGETEKMTDRTASSGTDGEEHRFMLDGIELKRTRWFDLFSAEDRVEFVRGLAAVVGWLLRDDATSGNVGKAG